MRKYKWLLIFILISCAISFFACEYVDKVTKPVMPEPEPPEVVEDDTLDTTTLQNRLTIEGATAVGRQLPATSTAETAPRIQADVGEINASPGGTISLPFAYSGTNALAGCIVCIEGVDGYFDLPYTGAPDALPTAISVSLPQNVALGSFTVCYSVYDDQGQTGNFINVVINVTEPPTEPSVPDMDPTEHYIYWTDIYMKKIQRANLDGTNAQDILTNLQRPTGIALDISGGKIYWTGRTSLDHSDPSGRNNIQRANLDGTGIETLVTGGPSVKEQIALDVAGGKMYWIDWSSDFSPANRIQRANLDGSNVEDIVTGLVSPRGIALDLSQGKMYWTDANRIQRANLDGSNIEDIVTEIVSPTYIALDFSSSKIYWGTWPGKIQRANFDGTNLEDLVVGLGHPIGIALNSLNGKMYWSDLGTDKIQRANLDGSNIEDLVTGLEEPIGIALDVPSQ